MGLSFALFLRVNNAPTIEKPNICFGVKKSDLFRNLLGKTANLSLLDIAKLITKCSKM